MKKIYLSFITAFFFVSGSFAQTVVLGADAATTLGNPYTTLGAAFTSINASSQAGNIINITVTGVTVEPVSAALNQSAGPWTSLTIIPVGASQITGNINGHLVDLNGADNVTIDGLNAAGNSLAINNSNPGSSASTIRFIADASNNTLNKVNILGSAGNTLGTGFGVVFFSAGTVTGNDNNTINQCIISASSGGTPLNGIYSFGSSGAIDNSNNTVSVNLINDYFSATTASAGMNINSNNSGWSITNNSLYQTATRTATSAGTYNGIVITSGSGYTISNNVIGFSAPNATGTTNMIGLSAGSLGGTFPSAFTAGGTAIALTYNAINCAFTTGGAASSIQNNTIGGIALFTSSGATTTFGLICGIAVTSGNANIGTATGNTIGSATGASSIYAATTTAGGVISGIYCTSTNTINIQNNTIGGIDISGTTATGATGFKGIDVAGTGVYAVSNNNIGNVAANNIRAGYLLTGANLSNTATTPTAASGASVNQAILNSSTGATLNITSNIIQGILMSGSAASFTGISNTGAVTSTINLSTNQIGTAGPAGLITFSTATTGAITGISNTGAAATATIDITNNTMQGISCPSSGNFVGITNSGASGVAINITGNQLGTATGDLITFSAAMANTVREIFNNGGTGTCTLTIQSNSVRGIVHNVAATSFHTYISNTAIGLASVNINSNSFINLNVNTTGNVTFIADAGGLTSTGTSSCSGNAITTAFVKGGATGNIYVYTSGGNNVNGSTMTETGNNFSNITMSGSGTLFVWQNAAGVSSSNGPTVTISSNTFNNNTGGSGATIIMIVNAAGSATNCSSNTISNISGTGPITAISIGSANGQGTHNYASNIISSLTSTGTGGNVTGITGGAATVPTLNINSNSITGLSSTGAGSFTEGIRITAGAIVNINDNTVNTLTGSGTTSPQVAGIVVSNSPVTVNVFKNKINSLQVTAAITTVSPSVFGLELIGGTTITAYNNFIADLQATAINYTDAIQGIRVDNITALTTCNVYYNSVYMNAASTGANFGTTGIYQSGNATATTGALNLINNIIVNTSTANGTGFTVAHRRSNTLLTNYASTSNNNLFYTGTPSATRLIFNDGTNSDQTLSAYQTRVSTRDANSISLLPAFTSSTDLHLTNANCGIDGKGTPIAITTDIDAATRDANAPDVGADEFTASYSATSLAGVAGSAVCDGKNVYASPAVTTYATSVCDLIAKVLPSGGSPVAGRINVCVTRDASQLYFNGEPYVRRHYDLEPVTSNQTTTSATITMYFTDAEFTLYNTTNPVWPKLPTVATGGMASPYIGNVKVTQFHGTPTGGLPTSTPGNYIGSRVVFNTPVLALNGSIWSVTINVAGFSGFYLHTNNFNAPLPIIVNYLTGRRQGSNHLLNWKVTCATSPRAIMTLERSADSRNYTGINTITADAARCQQPFDYTDANPLNGMNYYRLKIVDADGKVTYSTTVALLNAVKGFDIISIAPNPVVADNFKLNLASAVSGKMEIIIFDMQGRLVNRQSISLIAGFNSLPVNVANLAAGTYTIKGSMTDDQSKVIRFVKQ
jgi:hypothetical protein